MKRIVEKAIPNSGVTQQEMLSWMRDIIVPALKELRQVINGRFGEVVTVTSDYTITERDEIVIADSSGGVVTVTLPPVIGWTKTIVVKRLGASNVVVQPNATDAANGVLIDTLASYTLVTTGRPIQLVSNGSNWFYISLQ